MHPITPELLIAAYRAGVFPMAEGRASEAVYWYDPDRRGILPLETFHIPRSLRKFLRHCPYRITADTAFEDVMRGCAERESTWINEEIIAAYTALARTNLAHSVECWQDGRLVGGLYGVSLGTAFFGESMFSRADNASKVALVALVNTLKSGGYLLLDTQFYNAHLAQFGCVEITRTEYRRKLAEALKHEGVFALTHGSTDT